MKKDADIEARDSLHFAPAAGWPDDEMASLRKSEARFRAIVGQAAVGVAEVEHGTGRFRAVNQRLCEIAGRMEAELLAMTFLEITHPEDIRVHEKGMARLLAGEIRDFTVEKRYLRKDGEPVWVNLTISALWRPGEPPGNNIAIVQDITRQKQMETALRQSETKYRTLFESAGDFIFVLRPDALRGPVIVEANRAAVERHGNSREELIGRSILEFNTPTCQQKKDEILSHLAEPGDTFVFETEHIDKDGQVFPVEVSARLVQIDPAPPFMLNIERDITERKRVEEELRKSKEAAERLAQEVAIITEIGRKIASTLDLDEVCDRFAVESRKLIPYDRLLVTRLDPQERVFTVVYAYGAVLPERSPGNSFPVAGSIGEVVWKKRAGVVIQAADEAEIDRICVYRGVISVQQMGILSLLTVPLISNDEVIGTINFRSKLPNAYTAEDLRLAEGIGREIAGAFVNAQLYTELRRTEKSLRQRQELYSRLIDAVPDAVVQTDLDFRIVFANQVAVEMGGYRDAGELLGKEMLSFIAPEDRERAEANTALMFERKLGPQPYQVVAPDGRRIAVEINADILRNEDGTPFGEIIICRDVTERKKLEQELRQTLDSLESRVRERTVELEEINVALRVLLKKGEQDLRRQEHDIQDNINRLIIPFLRKLKISSSIERNRAYANIIEVNLTNIVSPFLNQLSGSCKNLTPTEIQIAAMIRDGRSSKDIAGLMGVSLGTVVTHRNNIRKKLNLPSRAANLRSHLLSLP